jgi:hypothetical protein
MSSYEKTQESIVRQSQLKFVLDYTTLMGVKLSLKDIIGITNVLVDFCLNGWSTDLRKRVEACDEHIQSLLTEMMID